MSKQLSVNKHCQAFKRVLSCALFVLLASALSGCITFLTHIKVKGDGSGIMTQTITMNPEQIKASMEGVAKQMGATPSEVKETTPKDEQKSSKNEMFKDSDLAGKTVDMGEGVTFVSAEKIDTKTAAGVKVTYAFKDINKLSINPKPAAAMGTEGAGASSLDALKFRMSRKPGGNALLTVIMPPPAPDAPKDQQATPPAAPGESDPQMQAMVMQMFKGLHMGVSVEVEGKIVKTSSPYVEGSKVTLMDIDFDPLLADEKGMKTLNSKLEAAMGDDRKTMEALKGVKGIKVTTDSQVTVEFAPKK